MLFRSTVLVQVAPSPVVELNRVVAVARAEGAEAAWALLQPLVGDARLRDYAPLAAVRGELLQRLGRDREARESFERAAGLTGNARERDALLAEGQAKNWRLPKESGIQRYKGLGEMDYRELWDTTMDPDSRTLRQVTIGEAAAADEIFAILMGEDVESRRSFIQRNARDVRFLDI